MKCPACTCNKNYNILETVTMDNNDIRIIVKKLKCNKCGFEFLKLTKKDSRVKNNK